MGRECGTHVERGIHTGASLESRKVNDLLDLVGRIIIKRILGKEDWVVWTGLICLRIWTTGGLL
jgi:hypothetical protein